MNKRRVQRFVLLCLSWLLLICATEAMAANFDDLLSTVFLTRRAAYVDIVNSKAERREAAIDFLIGILKAPPVTRDFDGSLQLAIQALGKLKAEKSLPELMKHLEFIPNFYLRRETIETQGYYPVVTALIDIGIPSVTYMDKILLTPQESDVRRTLAFYVLKQIFGKDISAHFDELVASKKMAQSTADFLVDYLQHYKPVFSYPTDNTKWLITNIPSD